MQSHSSADEDPRVKCYGVDCPKCGHPCELHAAGVSRYRDDMDDARLSRDGIRKDTLYFGEVFPEIAEQTAPPPYDDEVKETPAGRVRELQREIVRKLADTFFHRPATFELMMRRSYYEYNQSDLARLRGVTRAAVSKAIRDERREILKAENTRLRQRCDDLARMTRTEAAVYKVCVVDGVLSPTEAAKQTGLGRATVYRVRHYLSDKYGILIHFQGDENKKIAKKVDTPRQR